MRGVSFIIGLIGIVALLTLGVSSAWASPSAAMPCHETGSDHGGIPQSQDAPSPYSAPAKVQMVMGCCIACVSPAMPEVPVAVALKHPRSLQPARLEMPHGRSPSPEHGPPKPSL